MKTKINIETWNRKELFQFFRTFDEPYFGITANVDVTIAYAVAKEKAIPFFIYYLHKSLIAVNETKALTIRIMENEVYIFDKIHASATIDRPDQTFGFSYIEFSYDQEIFRQNVESEIHRIRNSSNLFPNQNGRDVVHFSALPWIDFTSLSHARSFDKDNSEPKISFGKMTDHQGKKMMSCSVHANHCLVDGRDIGEYFERFQGLLNQR